MLMLLSLRGWLRLLLWWMPAAGDTLQLLALALSLCVRLSLVSVPFPPGLYTNLLLLPVLKLLGSRKWLWTLLLWLLWPLLMWTMLSLSPHAGLPLMSSGLWLLYGACTCGFVIGSASPFPMVETFASSCARQLFGLASESSDRLGGAVAIDGGGGRGGGSS